MNITTSLLFYLLLGGVVAVADYLAAEAAGAGQQLFRLGTALLFWPLYLPAMLQRSPARRPNGLGKKGVSPSPAVGTDPEDELAASIQQVEAELDLVLASLGAWSDAVLVREQHRFEELRGAWHAQAEKIRELDLLLITMAPEQTKGHAAMQHANERVATSYRARQANIERLRALRDRCRTDLMSTLAWVRELVTMIHLARYTGAPASRAEELVMQIATSIEGISEVASWRETDAIPADASAPE